jgi:hypothetical protein
VPGLSSNSRDGTDNLQGVTRDLQEANLIFSAAGIVNDNALWLRSEGFKLLAVLVDVLGHW